MKNKPLVSIVVSVYNSEEFLFESINSLLNQTFKDFELIIVNDCSTDDSLRIIEQLMLKDSRIILLNNQNNIGLTKSLNKAIKVSHGKYIARQDADDISYITRLEKQIDYLEKNSEVVLLGSKHIDIKNGKKQENSFITDEKINKDIYLYNPFAHSTAIFQKSIFIKIGLYDESYVTSQDFDAWNRLAQVGKIAMLNKCLVERRIHENSISSKRHRTQIINTFRTKFKYSPHNKIVTFFLVSNWVLYVLFRNIFNYGK